MDEPITITAMNGSIYQMVPAKKPGCKSILLLHGWTGDETSMWTLASLLETGGLMASMRGIFPADPGGYSWVDEVGGGLSALEAFDPAVEALDMVLRDIIVRTGMDLHRLVLAGFSQGAALALAAARKFSYKPAGVIAISGFLPDGDLDGLESPVFWGHGSQDEIIPIETAREGVGRLEGHGLKVHLCESDIGHKISHHCLRGVQEWIGQLPVEENHLHGD